MTDDLYINTTSAKILSSANSLVSRDSISFYYGDTINLNLFFLKETRVKASPLSSLDFTGKNIKVSVGLIGSGSLVSSESWNDSTPFSASVSVVNAGSNTSNCVQSLDYSGSYFSGSITLTMPGSSGTFSTSANATVFTTPLNHGFIVGQTVLLSFSSFEIPSISTNVPYAGTFYIASTPSQKTFTVSNYVGGSALSPAASLGIFSDTTTGNTATVIDLTANTFNTSTTHNFSVGDSVSFSQNGIFTGINAGTTYFVKTVPSNNTFTLSATSGGDIITGISFSSFVGSYTTLPLTTSSIDVVSSASQIQQTLAALPTIGSGNVIVSGTAPRFTISFVNSLSQVAISPLILGATLFSQPYKTGSLTLSGEALLQAVNLSSSLILEVSSQYNGTTQTLAQCSINILPSLTYGSEISKLNIDEGFITQPLVVGADYSFSILPVNQNDGSPFDLSGASMSANIYTSSGGNLVSCLNVTMPTSVGDPIFCLLSANQTSQFSILTQQTWYLKLLLTRADGSVLTLGSGNVAVIP